MSNKIYVTRKIPQPGLDLLYEFSREVEINEEDRILTREELLKNVQGKDGILCLLTDKIGSEVIKAADRAKVFANYAVGYNNIDVDAATQRKIIVTNTPGILTDTTADLAWALLFAIARRVVEADVFTRQGRFKGWAPLLFLGRDVTGATLGILGAGRIGTAVALKSQGFKMKVLYSDERKNEVLESVLGARRLGKEELLKESDFISVHLPLTKETFHFLDEEEFRLMKTTACIINTSRGPVINEEALVDVLKHKKIAGAALDVYEEEPKLTPGLAELNNVVIVPHIASASIETRTKMAITAAENLMAALKGEGPKNIVNPEVLL